MRGGKSETEPEREDGARRWRRVHDSRVERRGGGLCGRVTKRRARRHHRRGRRMARPWEPEPELLVDTSTRAAITAADPLCPRYVRHKYVHTK